MSLKIGICGLPNAGKSTFVKLVSQVDVLIAPYLFTTLKPQEVVAPVISSELKLLHSIIKTSEIRYPYLIFIDIPGLIRGAHKGEGLGNEFLSYLRGSDVILEIVRNFFRQDVPHPEGNLDVERDIMIIEEEIIANEKEIIERILKKFEKQKFNKEIEKKYNLLKDVYNNLVPGKRFLDFKEDLKEFNLLLTKEWFLLVNGEEIKINSLINFKNIYNLDLLWELEILSEELLKEEFSSKVQEFLSQFRKDLDLIQFFTFTKEITQGWFIKKNSKIIEAAAMIHSDFALKFKIAETLTLEKFLEVENWEKARKLGLIKNKGREDMVEENEIIHFVI